MLFCTLKHSVFTDIFVIIQNWKSCCRRIPARGFESPSLRHEVRACQVRRAFLFISNGKLCFYIYHFIPFTVWMIFVAISPFISPVTVPDRKRIGLYHRNAGVFNRRAEIRSCVRLCVTPPMMLIPVGEKEFLR